MKERPQSTFSAKVQLHEHGASTLHWSHTRLNRFREIEAFRGHTALTFAVCVFRAVASGSADSGDERLPLRKGRHDTRQDPSFGCVTFAPGLPSHGLLSRRLLLTIVRIRWNQDLTSFRGECRNRRLGLNLLRARQANAAGAVGPRRRRKYGGRPTCPLRGVWLRAVSAARPHAVRKCQDGRSARPRRGRTCRG